MKIQADKKSYIYLAFSFVAHWFALGVDHYNHLGELNYIPNYVCAVVGMILMVVALISLKKSDNANDFLKTVNKLLLFTLIHAVIGILTKAYLGGVAVFIFGIVGFCMCFDMKKDGVQVAN